MTDKPKWFVFLTPAYIEDVKPGFLYDSYVDHQLGYLQCSKLETQEPYLAATVDSIDLTSSADLQIPHSAVSYILLDPMDKHLGFRIEPRDAGTNDAEHPAQS